MKLIVVNGPKSSGKTGSIKRASKILGVDFSSSPVADILCITKIRVGISNLLIGIASAGDSANEIQKNISFLKHHELDFIICACSAPTLGRRLLDEFADHKGAEKLVVNTRRVQKIEIENETSVIADKIVSNIKS